MKPIEKILNEFRDAATSNRDLGDKFERLMASALKLDSGLAGEFSNVWLWSDFPYRGKSPDVGIDLVAQEALSGDFVAIQCKFYGPDQTINKENIDSFFTASGKSFNTDEGKKKYSRRMIIATTPLWSKHAEDALENQNPPVSRLNVDDLANSTIDWSEFSLEKPSNLKKRKKKSLRPHQKTAISKVIEGFKTHDRGKLIMACGTGKTFTALKLVEQIVPEGGHCLFLVPSISLLSQTLREWTAESEKNLHCFAVCSDSKVGRNKDSDDISLHDLSFPATTNTKKLGEQIRSVGKKDGITVIFSTYQSIQVIVDAQKNQIPEFDLVICDEAHRTTGAVAEGDDESAFVKVHDSHAIKSKKRLYMTATPRVYKDEVKAKAKENNIDYWSMDDEEVFGPEFHRLGFSEAVSSGLLSDYKVMVLAVDEKHLSRTFQRQLADQDNELKLDDLVKIVGCWNGLSKKMAASTEDGHADNSQPMKRAVAFSRSIKDSEAIKGLFERVITIYTERNKEKDPLICEVDHVDGKMNSLIRNNKLNWLKADIPANQCRILSNARCLSEGVDVPALDAVMFLNPRNSVVDVVQSVGRVMRKAEGKQYGYIILPIGIPADIAPEEALNDNQKYKVVWQVLQALRAHDDRFNAEVNKLELNKQPPKNINIIGVGGSSKGDSDTVIDGERKTITQMSFEFKDLEEWKDAIYAKIVQKCGDRRYWEDWAKDVAEIATRFVDRIKIVLKEGKPSHKKAFERFLKGLQKNINPQIDEEQAIEMLAQHLITKPVFDALFEGYSFAKSNPVSIAMTEVLEILDAQSLDKETESLAKFYKSVRERASGIDNAEGKQRIIYELYDKFFSKAFPKLQERLGIVYTPVEVVDFIIKSADYALRKEFGKGLTSEGVNILDPFTGTGTFITRLLQSGLIESKDFARKYNKELFANEIVLLAYYIAAINIEETYHSILGGSYKNFDGISLTDTFQMYEGAFDDTEEMFPDNNQRIERQKKAKISVVLGNPPYSAGQKSENDNNKGLDYPKLDSMIAETYAKKSNSKLVKNLYDSYIRAIRLATNRIGDEGVIAFVTNGSFIEANNMDGLRKSLIEDFSSIYCFNLRGNGRTSGERCKQEGEPLFAAHGGRGGSLNSIAILILVKKSSKREQKILYHDIGMYLKRKEKLKIISEFESIKSIPWVEITPNADGDWINQRNPEFEKFIVLGNKEKNFEPTFFSIYSLGLITNRDSWIYNFSKGQLSTNLKRMIEFYNSELERYKLASQSGKKIDVGDFVDADSTKISWTHNLKSDIQRTKPLSFEKTSLAIGLYRPFTKYHLYFNRRLNERVYQIPKLFPTPEHKNIVFSVTGIGVTKPFSVIMTNVIPDIQLQANGQCFPLYYYEEFNGEYTRHDAISDTTLKEFQSKYSDSKITKEDIFYYIYGVLHSPEYRKKYESSLKKMLPRIPFVKDFLGFSKAGRELANWHLNYETIEPYPLHEEKGELMVDPKKDYQVTKMKFPKKGEQSSIIYNGKVTLSGIPPETYQYIVNGKSALEWVMERYAVTIDKDSGIKNDPNEWSEDPRYIIDLVKRVVRVSIETVRIVNNLPKLELI